jgi:hypothetical protein
MTWNHEPTIDEFLPEDWYLINRLPVEPGIYAIFALDNDLGSVGWLAANEMSALSGSNTIHIDANGVVSVKVNPYGIIDVTDVGLLLEWAVNAGIATLGTDSATQVYIKSRIDELLNGKQNSFSGQSANRIYAGPESGDNAIPGFRPLVPADIPWLNKKMDITTTITPTGTTTLLLDVMRTLPNGFYSFGQSAAARFADMPAGTEGDGWYNIILEHGGGNLSNGNFVMKRVAYQESWTGVYGTSSTEIVWQKNTPIKGTGTLTIADGEYTTSYNLLWYSIRNGRVHMDFRVELSEIITPGTGALLLNLPTEIKAPTVSRRFRCGAGWIQYPTNLVAGTGLWLMSQVGNSMNFWASGKPGYTQYSELQANSVFTGSMDYDID